jgi:formate-dependent nitrite reductase cytochrome c552 subunit
LDKALSSGEIPATLPFIKKTGLEALKATYNDSRDATEKIPTTITNFYNQTYPQLTGRSQEISRAAQAVLAIYKRNVFPELKVSWGTYPNNLGHTDFPGCFRCHDGAHATKDGKSIPQDCDSCHQMLANDESSPEILKTLGLTEPISQTQK